MNKYPSKRMSDLSYSHAMSVRIASDQWLPLKQLSQQTGYSINMLISLALEQLLLSPEKLLPNI